MKYYVVVADEGGNWSSDKGNRAQKASHQREAAMTFARKNPIKEGQSYVVLLLPEGPCRLERYSDNRLAQIDWDYWTFDENLNQHGVGEGPPITL